MAETRYFANFIKVVELGSISRAADQAAISQSALSQQIAVLENEFRCQLLHRTSKGMVPTAAGKELFRHLKAVVHHLEAARHDIASVGGEVAGSVSVGLPVSMSEILSAALFLQARERYPGVHLRVIALPNRFLLKNVLDHAVDFAFIIGLNSATRLIAHPLASEKIYLMTAPGSSFDTGRHNDPIQALELSRGDFILPSHPHSIRTLLDEELALAGLQMTVAGEMDSHTTMIELVATGHFHSILPWSAIAAAVEQGTIRARPIAKLQRNISICSSETAPLSNAAEAIRDLALQIIRDLVAQGKWRGLTLSKMASPRTR